MMVLIHDLKLKTPAAYEKESQEKVRKWRPSKEELKGIIDKFKLGRDGEWDWH